MLCLNPVRWLCLLHRILQRGLPFGVNWPGWWEKQPEDFPWHQEKILMGTVWHWKSAHTFDAGIGVTALLWADGWESKQMRPSISKAEGAIMLVKIRHDGSWFFHPSFLRAFNKQWLRACSPHGSSPSGILKTKMKALNRKLFLWQMQMFYNERFR